MELHGNKGEWSEVYAFLKLLGEKKIYAGDENLDRIEDLFYPIICILREESKYCIDNTDIVVRTSEEDVLIRIPAVVFLEQAKNLLKTINEQKGAFSVPYIERFMHSIGSNKLKAGSNKKTDLNIVLHDCRTKIDSLMGFSIKSQLGSPSTLFNAGKNTNFIYRIEECLFSQEEIMTINAIDRGNKVFDRISAIEEKGGRLTFTGVDDRVFYNNLIMIDSMLPQILANMLLDRYRSGASKIKDITEHIGQSNPLGYDLTQNNPFYVYKIKQLLVAFALGMVPATPWNGKLDANGGYIVVKDDGEILCYHFYDRNRFEDYLFSNVKLDTPSTTRHGFAIIENDGSGNLIFKLNFQIRFLK